MPTGPSDDSRAAKRLRPTDEAVSGLPFVQAEINFGGGTHKTSAEAIVAERVTVYDGRADVSRFAMARDGFELVDVPGIGDVQEGGRLDLYDPDVAVETFFPRVEALVRRHLGARRAIAFDHIVRNRARLSEELARAAGSKDMAPSAISEQSTSDESPLEEDACPALPKTKFLQGALSTAHGDYTARSGRTRAEQLLEPWSTPGEIAKALAGRFAIVNVWYPLETVKADPLALCLWESCSPDDVVTNRLIFPHRVGETYKVRSSPGQRWIYFSDVTADEAILLKTFDSVDDGSVSRFCLHSAFRLPEQDSPSPPPDRQSLEVRVLVFYGEGTEGLALNFVPPHMVGEASATEIMAGPLRTELVDTGGAW